MQYIVVYEETPTGWSAYVPDLPGCVAAAETRAEVESLIREAIAMHLALMREHGDPIPAPGAWTGLVEV
jgi:predicted RNase H-like HicB family nuclease